MNDLPQGASQQQNPSSPADTSSAAPQPAPTSTPPVSQAPASAPGVGGKEFEGSIAISREVPLTAVGVEVDLSKEVASAGVRIAPTTIPVPPVVAKMGVTQTGMNAQVVATPTISLPISDDQIAAGLHQSIVSSWRWLAEWCIKRLKQLHLHLVSVHGKITRARE